MYEVLRGRLTPKRDGSLPRQHAGQANLTGRTTSITWWLVSQQHYCTVVGLMSGAQRLSLSVRVGEKKNTCHVGRQLKLLSLTVF